MEKKLFFKTLMAAFLAIGTTGCMTNQIKNDPYIWLEEVNSEKSLAWVKTHNQRTVDELQKNSRYQKVTDESLAILSAKDKLPTISFHNGYVYNFWTDTKNPRGLYRRTTYANYKTAKPNWEIILDIDKLGKDEGKSWVFHGCSKFRPNSDRCMMALSDGGKDAEEIREFDLQKKAFIKNGFFIPLAKSSFSWVDLDTLLISTDFGPGSLTESGYPREVRAMKRGQTISQAEKIFEIPAHHMSAHSYDICDAESCEFFIIESKDFYRRDLYKVNNAKELIKLEIPETAEFHGIFKGQYYFYLTQDWKKFKTGSLLRAEFGNWENAQEVYVPNKTSSFEGISFTKNDIYIAVMENVNRKVYKMDQNFRMIPFPSPAVGNTYVSATDVNSDKALFTFENSVMAPAIYEWNEKLTKIKSTEPRFDNKNLVVEQYEATSFDGTKIPYFVIRDKTKTGPQPTIMTAYGGFQISMYPYYNGVQGKVWLSQGGQYVIASIRGGGEFGPTWHRAAIKQNRQVAYNDLFAVTEDVIKKGFTSSSKLAFTGGSNGGLLAGVALTQRPDLYKAIIIDVPLLDMIRYHKLPAGASWIGEYGNPEIDSERSYIEKYSPYQNLQPGKNYPSIMLMTSTFDDRVHPGHARKFGARLEEFKVPFYYYENMEGGHSAAADLNQRAKYYGLFYSFIYNQLMN